jgi:anaerobic selenocysteine-containing dehydrogenase
LPERLCTADKRIDCLPSGLLPEFERALRSAADSAEAYPLLLIGRRHLRSNNSWMHNSHRLVKGKPRCHLLMHSKDAQKLALADGERVAVNSAAGRLETELALTDDIMPGVVSLPHGWGHNRAGVQLKVAAQHAGVSINDVTDRQRLDVVSGNAVLSGVPVSVSKI